MDAFLTATQARLALLADQMAQLPSLEALVAHYDPYRLYGGPGSEFLPMDQMNERIGYLTAAATDEILTAQPDAPSDRDPQVVRMGIDRTVAALHRGVDVRSLYTSAAYQHAQTRETVAELVEAGADVRAYGSPFPRLVLIGRRHLFIDNHVTADSDPNCGWHVTDRASVMWIRASFRMTLDQGTPWRDLDELLAAAVTSDRHRRILRVLEDGYSQQQVGPRIGLKERTVNKELKNLREELARLHGAEGPWSMYQVMAWWGRSPERDL
ncbi:hypothetical protein [Streptomyces sp. NPDC050738]|uniref:hypothetical protein n=1 Tax=Streptomyces sp. NPDC050738 TaxID=3154744 RepID=UPI003440A258